MESILLLSFIFLGVSLVLIIIKPNLLFLLFALEIILLGANLNFIFGSTLMDDFLGKFLALILFSVAALDTSVGLILLLNFYGLHGHNLMVTTIKS